jgi:hypothetical protein
MALTDIDTNRLTTTTFDEKADDQTTDADERSEEQRHYE